MVDGDLITLGDVRTGHFRPPAAPALRAAGDRRDGARRIPFDLRFQLADSCDRTDLCRDPRSWRCSSSTDAKRGIRLASVNARGRSAVGTTRAAPAATDRERTIALVAAASGYLWCWSAESAAP